MYCGDYLFGHHYNLKTSIAQATAASASFPYVIGKTTLNLPKEGWWQVNPSTKEKVKSIEKKNHKIRLWDGGIYENLGSESLTKNDKYLKNRDHATMIICDGGARLWPDYKPATGILSFVFPPSLRTPRLSDISSSQIEALRRRRVMQQLLGGKRGALVRIGVATSKIDQDAGNKRNKSDYKRFLKDETVREISKFPTNLKKLSDGEFDLILRHGFEVASVTLSTHVKNIFKKEMFFQE